MSNQKQLISPLVVKQTRDFSGLQETNNLVNAYLTEPEKVGSILAYAFGKQENNVLSLLTGGIGNTLTVNNKEYQWDLHSENERSIGVSVTSPDGGTTPGIGGMPFRIYLEENWFSNTDVLVADDGTQVRVKGEAYQDGASWVYTVELTDPNKSFIDPSQIAQNARFSKDYSTVAEYSSEGGGHGFQTPITLRNTLSTLRKTFKVTRNAAKAVMVVELHNPENPEEKTKLWTQVSEWAAMSAWYRELDRHAIYSILSKDANGFHNLKDGNQRPVITGAGLRQQIAPSNRRYYTKLTYDILDEFLLDLSYSSRTWGGETHFVALTGKMGIREFDRAIKDHARGNNITVTDSGTFISGNGEELDFTGYFKTVHFLNGVSLSVKQFDPYDDIARNRTLHPKTKKPIESYRMTIMNFGTDAKGNANIRKTALTDSEMMMWHVAGSTDPYAGVAKSMSTMRASGIDGYDVHFASECGIMVGDPTSCGELILRLS